MGTQDRNLQTADVHDGTESGQKHSPPVGVAVEAWISVLADLIAQEVVKEANSVETTQAQEDE